MLQIEGILNLCFHIYFRLNRLLNIAHVHLVVPSDSHRQIEVFKALLQASGPVVRVKQIHHGLVALLLQLLIICYFQVASLLWIEVDTVSAQIVADYSELLIQLFEECVKLLEVGESILESAALIDFVLLDVVLKSDDAHVDLSAQLDYFQHLLIFAQHFLLLFQLQCLLVGNVDRYFIA